MPTTSTITTRSWEAGLHDGVVRGFHFDLTAATIIDIGVLPNGITSVGYAINNLGTVAGASDTGTLNRHGQRIFDGVLWQDDSLTDLGSLGDSAGYASGINDGGVVVGTYFRTTRDRLFKENRAFVWEGDVMQDLNTLIPSRPRWVLWRAADINGSGGIVGTGQVGSGRSAQEHGYLLVPETALSGHSIAPEAVAGALTAQLVKPELTKSSGRIHFQFDSQDGLASGQAPGRFVYEQFLRPVDGEDEGDDRHDDDTGGQAAFRGPGPAPRLAELSYAIPASWGAPGGPQDGAPAAMQPRRFQLPRPIEVLAASSSDDVRLIQDAGPRDWPADWAAGFRVRDRTLADRGDSLFADPVQGDENYAWVR